MAATRSPCDGFNTRVLHFRFRNILLKDKKWKEKVQKNAQFSFSGGKEAFHQEIVLRGITSRCLRSLIGQPSFLFFPNMVLSKMNNHEHWTRQTYESYTFQPLKSFWFHINYSRIWNCLLCTLPSMPLIFY